MTLAEPDFTDFSSNAGNVDALSTEITVHRLVLLLILLLLMLIALSVFHGF